MRATRLASKDRVSIGRAPFEALFWSPEFEYSEFKIANLLHDKERLGQWFDTVPEFEAYESGSEAKVKKVPKKEAS